MLKQVSYKLQIDTFYKEQRIFDIWDIIDAFFSNN